MSVIQKALDSYFQTYPIADNTKIAVAVSGGADSLCLALSLAEYAKKNHLRLFALTVNHGLRKEALSEAKEVGKMMKSFGIPHTILSWQGKKPTTKIEEKAREKRYELMLNFCKERGIKYLFLAHHAGDQAETFWERLARGSGVDGLSAMGAQTIRLGVFLCRPFLNLTKQDCQNALKKRKIKWAEDPMNHDETYERVRWRLAQKTLSKMGLNEQVINKTTWRLGRAREALDFYAYRFIASLVDWSGQGYATIQENAFRRLPDEIQIRVINFVLRQVGKMSSPISLERLEQWVVEFPKKTTLAHCLVLCYQGVLYVLKEVKHMDKKKQVPKNKIVIWDRFLIKSPVATNVFAGGSDKELPLSIRQSVPSVDACLPISFLVGTQKELEKQMQVDYKDVIQIGFIKDVP